MVFPLFHWLLLFKVTEYRCAFQCHISVSGVGSSSFPTPACLATALSYTHILLRDLIQSHHLPNSTLCLRTYSSYCVFMHCGPLPSLLAMSQVTPTSASRLLSVPVLHLNTLCKYVRGLLCHLLQVFAQISPSLGRIPYLKPQSYPSALRFFS